MTSETAHAILEKKQMLEEDLRRVEKQIYDLEGEYLQVCAPSLYSSRSLSHSLFAPR
jgi:hypothetical protein